jgi:ParB-like chromosome segregation protein Spo0J
MRKVERSPCDRGPPDERLRVEFWGLDKLIPFARNARPHSDTQIAEIAGSIRAFGFTNPILVGANGDVIAGHGRLAAARQLGLMEVPVIPLHRLTEMQRRQLVLADNRIALNAGWDLEMLKLELTDLAGLGADLSMLGFDKEELAAALTPASSGGLTDENEVPTQDRCHNAGRCMGLGGPSAGLRRQYRR